jgi:hypothetical protein
MAVIIISRFFSCWTYADGFAGPVVSNFLQVNGVDGAFASFLAPQAPRRQLNSGEKTFNE